MFEVWLHPNRRALVLAMVLPGLGFLIGLILLLGIPGKMFWLRAGAGLLLLASALMLLMLVAHLRVPRLAYRDGYLLVYLRSGVPTAVPIDFVEAFLLGQGASHLPGPQAREVATRNLVIRIAEQATEWQQVDVKQALGTWCGGYITIRGTWCEPLSLPLVERLNQRLHEIKQGQRQVTLP